MPPPHTSAALPNNRRREALLHCLVFVTVASTLTTAVFHAAEAIMLRSADSRSTVLLDILALALAVALVMVVCCLGRGCAVERYWRNRVRRDGAATVLAREGA